LGHEFRDVQIKIVRGPFCEDELAVGRFFGQGAALPDPVPLIFFGHCSKSRVGLPGGENHQRYIAKRRYGVDQPCGFTEHLAMLRCNHLKEGRLRSLLRIGRFRGGIGDGLPFRGHLFGHPPEVFIILSQYEGERGRVQKNHPGHVIGILGGKHLQVQSSQRMADKHVGPGYGRLLKQSL